MLGTSGNRHRIEYSNAVKTAPGVTTTRTPTVNRYRVGDTVLTCDGAALADDKYPSATSLINGRPYGPRHADLFHLVGEPHLEQRRVVGNGPATTRTRPT